MSLAAELTEGVPYIGAISKALTAFEEVLDVSLNCIAFMSVGLVLTNSGRRSTNIKLIVERQRKTRKKSNP